MFELLVLGFVGLVLMAAFGLLAAIASMIWWVIALPFKLLALAFKGLAAVLALPFLILFGILGVALFGVGLFAFFIPALPLILIVALVVALFRKRDEKSSATVV